MQPALHWQFVFVQLGIFVFVSFFMVYSGVNKLRTGDADLRF